MKEIVLDTETTGLSVKEGHRIVEIGCIELNDLIKDWTNASEKILLVLKKKDQSLTKNMNPKSLMAFGAMGAHINMALQALKATGFNQ